MTAGSYEHEIAPIRGDTFLDKLFGWMTLVLGLVVLGAAIFRLTRSEAVVWLESARTALILLGLAGAFMATISTVRAFQTVIALYAVRLVGCLSLWPWAGGPRYAGSELFFDLVVLGYAWMRIRSMKNR